MKTRNGFVSNSSSSSFVVLLPENFSSSNFTDEEIQKAVDAELEDQHEMGGLRKWIDQFIAEKGVYEYDNHTRYAFIREIFEKYTIGGVDVSSDQGQIVLADPKKVKDILSKDSNEN